MSVKLEVITESKEVITEFHASVSSAETALQRLQRLYKVVKHSITKAIKHVELPLSKPVHRITAKRYSNIN